MLAFSIIKALIHYHPLSSPRSSTKVTQENSSDSSRKLSPKDGSECKLDLVTSAFFGLLISEVDGSSIEF